MSIVSSKLETVARRAAARGAAIHRRYYETGLAVRHKGEINLVTRADVESQRAIVKVLSSSFPDHAILAEEGAEHRRPLDGPVWVVDPLDGTTNYAHGLPIFSISLAYRERGRTLFGLVYLPILDEMFVAHLGKGARRNGRPIRVTKERRLAKALLATGFPYDRRTSKDNNLAEFCRFELAAFCVRRFGAASVDLAYLACGRYDGFWEPKLAPWDIAAGALLVEEAGGKVTDYRGRPLDDLWCDEIVASNGPVHGAIVRQLRSLR